MSTFPAGPPGGEEAPDTDPARPPRSAAEVAESLDTTPATLRRWAKAGLIPGFDGEWTPAAVASARIVARMRERGHTLAEIREAEERGQLAFGYIEALFPTEGRIWTVDEVADETDLEPALVQRIYAAVGFGQAADRLTDAEVELLRYAAAVLAAGFPLVAFLQLVRVYGQSLAKLADAEIRLFHLYVHEPLMHAGVPGLEMAEEMEGLARELLPLSTPIMELIHRRYLQHFMEQDVVGHMEVEAEGSHVLGRMRVAIAFADLAGYTRLTEEEGEEEALGAVERFVAAVEGTLPDEARVIKTIGDEVMIVGSDVATLIDWAVGFQELATERPRPRIGIHYGVALYREGDYYGREVNLAARVAARAAGGEVLVTRPVVDGAGSHLEFEHIGEVRLKGFSQVTELFLAHVADES